MNGMYEWYMDESCTQTEIENPEDENQATNLPKQKNSRQLQYHQEKN